MSYVPYRRVPTAGLQSWLPPIAVTSLLWWTSSNSITLREGLLAGVLLFFPCHAYSRWQREGKTRIPLFAMLALAYWAAFGMPLFLSTPPADPRTHAPFSEASVFDVLTMAVLGVMSLGVGMKTRLRLINPAAVPDVAESLNAWRYLYWVMALGTAITLHGDVVVSGTGSQLLMALSNIVPIAIGAMLAIRRAEGTATPPQRLALTVFVIARIIMGIASGWLGSVVFMGVILWAVYVAKHRRLPVRAFAIIIPVILFLQVGKTAFRGVYWTEHRSGNIFEKASFWMDASYREWKSAFTTSDRGGKPHDLVVQSINRVSLLSQSVNVLVKTPRVVPYQVGGTYSYLAATLIPRFVWPDKPTVNDANRFYQLAYGLTSKADLDTVSIAVGCLTESFINFGWWGVIPVMLVTGLILGLFEQTLLGYESGLLFCGIGLALLSTFLAIESQAAQYFGGLLQQIAVVFVVVLPVIRRRGIRRDQPYGLPEAV